LNSSVAPRSIAVPVALAADAVSRIVSQNTLWSRVDRVAAATDLLWRNRRRLPALFTRPNSTRNSQFCVFVFNFPISRQQLLRSRYVFRTARNQCDRASVGQLYRPE